MPRKRCTCDRGCRNRSGTVPGNRPGNQESLPSLQDIQALLNDPSSALNDPGKTIKLRAPVKLEYQSWLAGMSDGSRLPIALLFVHRPQRTRIYDLHHRSPVSVKRLMNLLFSHYWPEREFSPNGCFFVRAGSPVESAPQEFFMTRTANLDDLSDTDHLHLLAGILEACLPPLDRLDATTVTELMKRPVLSRVDRPLLSRLVSSLATTGLLWQPPHSATRNARYITTTLGRQAIEMYRRQGKRRPEPFRLKWWNAFCRALHSLVLKLWR